MGNQLVARAVLFGTACCLGLVQAASASESRFTYQGVLNMNGVPLTGTADFQLSLYFSPVGGSQFGSTVDADDVIVENGLFEIEVDFGPTAFLTAPRFIEVAVRAPAGGGAYTTLTPRQAVNATPFSSSTRGITVTAGELVGLGTNTPDVRLEVLSFDTEAARLVREDVVSNAPIEVLALHALGEKGIDDGFGGSLGFYLQDSDFDIRHAGAIDVDWLSADAANPTADMSFRIRGSDPVPTERMRILGNGQVGIGTTSPAAQLGVEGLNQPGASIRRRQLTGNLVTDVLNLVSRSSTVVQDNFGGALNFQLQEDNGSILTAAGLVARWSDVSQNELDLVIRSRINTGAVTERMIFRADGFLGINRNFKVNPNERIGINVMARQDEWGGIFVNATDARGLPFIGFATGGTERARQYYSPSAAAWRLTAGVGNMSMEADTGQVSVGHFSPQGRFDVVGFNEISGRFQRQEDTGNSILDVLDVVARSTATISTGFGARLNFKLEAPNGAIGTDGTIQVEYIDPTVADAETRMTFRLRDGLQIQDRLTIFSDDYAQLGEGAALSSSDVFVVHTERDGFRGITMNTPTDGRPYFGYGIDGAYQAISYTNDDAWHVDAGGFTITLDRNNGFFGIGDMTPDERLDVIGSAIITGTLSKGGGSFKIDHPLDPQNKYLYHSFVESPDMMNVYNGNVRTDDNGYATIDLPDWFEALNRDFRYQLTVIDEADNDSFVMAKVVRGVADNAFTIRTSEPNTQVSWLVTGVRQDKFADANRIPVEEWKDEENRGKYLHPTAWNETDAKGEDWVDPATKTQMPPAGDTRQ